MNEREVTLRVRIQCGDNPEEIIAEILEALTTHDQWPMEVLDLDTGVVTNMTIPAPIRSVLTPGGIVTENLPSFEVGEKVLFEEITFSEDGNWEHDAVITEVLIPRKFYNLKCSCCSGTVGEDDGGRNWTAAVEMIRRPE